MIVRFLRFIRLVFVTCFLSLLMLSVAAPVYAVDLTSGDFVFDFTDELSGGLYFFAVQDAENPTASLNDAYDDSPESIIIDPGQPTEIDLQNSTNYTVDAAYLPGSSNREFMSETLTLPNGLESTMRMYIPDLGRSDYAYSRFLLLLDNPTGSPITTTVSYRTNLGSDNDTEIATSSDGDNVATTDDFWATSFESDTVPIADPPLGYNWGNEGARLTATSVLYEDGRNRPQIDFDLTVPTGERVILMVFQPLGSSVANVQTLAEELYDLPGEALANISPGDQAQIMNWKLIALEVTNLIDATEAGANGSYDLALTSAITDPVTVNLTTDGQCTVSPTSLTFTLANAATPQTVTVTAINDNVVEGAHTCTITNTPSQGGNVLTDYAESVAININDAAPTPTPTMTPTPTATPIPSTGGANPQPTAQPTIAQPEDLGVQQLPSTGETPFWASTLRMIFRFFGFMN